MEPLGDIQIVSDVPKTITIDDSTGIFGLDAFLNHDKMLGGPGDVPAAPIDLQPLDNLMGSAVPDLAPMNLEPLPIGNTIQITREPDVKPVSFETHHPAPTVESRAQSHEDELIEKGKLLSQIKRLKSKGVFSERMLTTSSSLDEIRSEHHRMFDEYKRARFVTNWRGRITKGASMAEFMSKRFRRMGLNLDGFSEKISMEIDEDEYDDVLDDFYDEMKDIEKLPAWMRLAGGIGASAFLVHVSNTMTKASTPGIDEIADNNPALAKEIASTMARDIAGAATPQYFAATAPRPAVAAAAATGVRAAPAVRREMKPPADVDDILNSYVPPAATSNPAPRSGGVRLRPVQKETPAQPTEEAPRAHLKEIKLPVGGGPIAMPEAPRGVRVTAMPPGPESIGIVGMPLGHDFEETGSIQSGTSSRRGRPRRALPTGNSVNIDV